MLLSHRHHAAPFSGASLSLHRLVSPSFVAKRAVLRGLVQDERLTSNAFRGDVNKPRRLAIVLDGELHDVAQPGDAFFARPDVHTRWTGDVLELEWDAGALDDDDATRSPVRVRLGSGARARATELADLLRDETSPERVVPALARLLEALRAEGLPFEPERLAVCPTPERDDALMRHVDAALSDLAAAPMLVDLEASAGLSRRTLTRAIRDVHERYGLLGRGEGRWRAIRDVYRLVVATILVSHPEATPRAIAGYVGYGSVEALDHAFRHAGLDTPLALGRAVRAA